MQAVIIAGGLATRLGDLSKGQPKSMIRINGKPFLSYQLDFLKKGGISNIVLCVGHLKEQIVDYFNDGKQYGIKLKYSYEDNPLGTAGALKNANPLLDDIFYVIYGDSYLFLDFYNIKKYFDKQDKIGLLTVLKNNNKYDRSNTDIKGSFVVRYDKKNTKDMSYIDYGAILLRRKALELVPSGRYSSMEDLFVQLINNKELLAYEIKDRFYEIGSLSGLNEFFEYISSTSRG
jgi:N-acetyl-alpha-D-muramate 1-phosphate uridylyltransferase